MVKYQECYFYIVFLAQKQLNFVNFIYLNLCSLIFLPKNASLLITTTLIRMAFSVFCNLSFLWYSWFLWNIFTHTESSKHISLFFHIAQHFYPLYYYCSFHLEVYSPWKIMLRYLLGFSVTKQNYLLHYLKITLIAVFHPASTKFIPEFCYSIIAEY